MHSTQCVVRCDSQGSNLGALSSKGFRGCVGLTRGVGLHINAHPYDPLFQAWCRLFSVKSGILSKSWIPGFPVFELILVDIDSYRNFIENNTEILRGRLSLPNASYLGCRI